ncbi:DNA-binding protein [Pseudomonas sp. EA_35y_Pfl2_R5]|uniref:DNA-binding protein n=1 Tax=Pseudomonas sp. EA_35y_Pfl2_R5 TaxID=3088690 RepID=UPI0030D9C43D
MRRSQPLAATSRCRCLLSLQQLAEVLHRSKDGLRVSLSGNSELSAELRRCKVKIGRRVYFKTSAVARVIEEA